MESQDVRVGGWRNALIGSFVGAYAIFDSLVLVAVIVVLVLRFDPLGVYLGSIAVITALNLACCRWLDHHWDSWVAGGHARRLEPRLAKLRESSAMRRPVAWITGGSTALFALAAAVINPVIVIGAGRMIGGQPIGDRRIGVASLSYAVVVSSLYLVVAIAVRQAIR